MAESITVTDLENAKLDAITIEEVATSQLDTTTDRKGNTKNTLQGALKTLGFIPPVTYAAAISFAISDNTKTVEEAGVIYAPLPSALPFTTTGTFVAGDDAKFFVVQGITSSNIRDYTNINFTTVADLKADTTVKVGDFVTVESYTGTNNSGVMFFDIVAASTGTADDGSFIDLPGSGLQAKQNFSRFGISVKQFGATGDGTADDTAPIQSAINYLSGGGNINIPTGWYRTTSSLVVHSGLSFIGEGKTNLTYGTPTNNERPSHIFIDTDNEAVFTNVNGVQLETVSFVNLSIGSKLFPDTTALANRIGVQLTGSNPVDAKNIVFSNCQFSNLAIAIQVDDPLAGTGTDWNCAPVTMDDCVFFYNSVGVRLNADNADTWVLTNCSWFMNTGQTGVLCVRSGFLTFISCFGGGGTMVVFNGASRDNTKFINCQYEAADAFIVVDDTMTTQQTFRPITLDTCIIEAGITLNSECHFVTTSCRFTELVTVTGDNVIIDSAFDTFLGAGGYSIVGANSKIQNFLKSESALPPGVRGPIINGQMVDTGGAAPVTGTYIQGDEVKNILNDVGEPAGWVCVASGTPGTWVVSGQAGYRVVGVDPVGSVTPFFVGEELLSSSTGLWYKSVGVTTSSWNAIG